MTGPYICCKLLTGKNKLAEVAFTDGSHTATPAIF